MKRQQRSSAYSRSGVDIDAQDRALRGIREIVESTRTAGVLSELGSFGGLFAPDLGGCAEPVLVSSADGVGTKLMVARMAGDYSTVGRDLVNHCVNDILVQGAAPLFFLDYVGAGRLDPDAMRQLVGGVAAGCRENGCALLGGETAEMPGFYQEGDYELVGFIVGLVDRSRLIDGSRVAPRDVLVGLPSAGLHTNGFSLARRALLEAAGLGLEDRLGETGMTVGEHLLAPHLSYLAAVRPLLGRAALHGIAHITGGGLTDNLPRILPRGLQAEIRLGSWEIPELFAQIQRFGEVDSEEMLRVFNMGIGLVLAVAPESLGEVLRELRQQGQRGIPIGTVQEGPGGVVYDPGVGIVDE
ncbi:MAG: phosphoribosylformylglycinamidine cyclo-ligase [Acidobacteria bacterium]|nr:MAG: phosphoribosylformylglycinamidine cyclo-ligase [Acidobacteriota bacterium]REK12157.1 MAG: phosphoribosylformylglycinamidine cyclo-ligase [Acidobacteriota bacterium]